MVVVDSELVQAAVVVLLPLLLTLVNWEPLFLGLFGVPDLLGCSQPFPTWPPTCDAKVPRPRVPVKILVTNDQHVTGTDFNRYLPVHTTHTHTYI